MSKTRENIQQLLDHENAYTQWFALHESQSQALIKRNLKFLRGLHHISQITLAEVDQLTEQDIQSIVSSVKTRPEPSGKMPEKPTTQTDFFYSTMFNSPYFSEIIPYSDSGYKKSEQETLSVSLTAPAKNNGVEVIHGFHLNDNEAFSSTRYFSKDKTSFATIIAKNGAFKAHHQNLTPEQETDLAFEMTFQFLLNLPPERKTITLTGPPEIVHKMRAALLQFQNESGERFKNLNYILPEGMSIAPDELNDDYIKKHLGTPKETPQQLVQWRQFLILPSTAPEKTDEASVKPPPTEERKPRIDMERILHAPDLTEEDRLVLNEYQCYLQQKGINNALKTMTETAPLIEKHDEFTKHTEGALRVLHKAPSLQKEYAALKALYIDLSESHYEMLEQLHQNTIAYEKEMNELLPDYLKAEQLAREDCMCLVKEQFDLLMFSNVELNPEQQNELAHHRTAMKEATRCIEENKTPSVEMARSCGAQLYHAMQFLEAMPNYSKPPLFDEMKYFSKQQSEKQDHLKRTSSEDLAHTAQGVKERLNQFKKEFRESKEADIPVTPQMKGQLNALNKKLERFINSNETVEDKGSLEDLSREIQKIWGAISVTGSQLDALNQSLDKALPLIKDHAMLTKALLEIKELAKAQPAAVLSSLEEKLSNPNLN